MIEEKTEDRPLPPKFDGLGGVPENSIYSSLWFKVAFVGILIALSLWTGTLLVSGKENKKVSSLEAENRLLRAKLELYATTVDSIYSMLDSLQATSSTEAKDYPYYSGDNASEAKPDPALKSQFADVEYKLMAILEQLGMENSALSENPLRIKDIPAIYPTFGRISDAWGMRVHPISGQLEFHQGLDIANNPGTPIYATAAGIVVKADFDPGYGKRLMIDHGNGYRTLYAHLYNHQVRVGDEIGKGQIIALMGNTGVSTGPHLHYEVQYQGAKVNPVNFLNRIDDETIR